MKRIAELIYLLKDSVKCTYVSFLLLVGIIFAWSHNSSLMVTGRVVNKGKPVQGAIVRLQATSISDTTDIIGNFIVIIALFYCLTF